MQKNQVVLDIELYSNYLLIMFVNCYGKTKYFEKFNDSELDYDGVISVMNAFEVVTFNGNNYDIPILTLALKGASNATLKVASDAIITENLRSWDFYKRYNLKQPSWNHIDLIEPAPAVKISLKLYGGRLHSKKLQDLPIEPDTIITDDMVKVLRLYCRNDLDTTIDLLHGIEDRIELRRQMSKQYGIDLRSKSDAQIAEAVIKQQVESLTGQKVKKAAVSRQVFRYQKPDFIRFSTDQLKKTLAFFEDVEFISEKNGVISMSAEPEIVTIGNTQFKLGMGGLHSQESEIFHKSDDEYCIIDADFTAYYPNIIIQLGLYPQALGMHFLTVFKDIKETREKAKREGDKLVDSSMKIMINGTFGKLGSAYSVLHAPNLMIQTTVTGQLVLLMLIEKLYQYGIEVVSGNTDGIVMKVLRKHVESRMKPIIHSLEALTGYNMEFTDYSAIYNRDVNSYVAIKPDGKVKTKGFFGQGGLQKSPTNEICAKAFIAYIKDGVPIEDTVMGCKDIREFLSIRTVKGGAVKDGQYLGKVVRWYYSKGESGTINYKTNDNMVPRSTGGKPLMVLPDEFPDDVNFGWYIKEAYSMLYDVGLVKRPTLTKLPRRNTNLWKEMFATGEIVEYEGEFIHKNDLSWKS